MYVTTLAVLFLIKTTKKFLYFTPYFSQKRKNTFFNMNKMRVHSNMLTNSKFRQNEHLKGQGAPKTSPKPSHLFERSVLVKATKQTVNIGNQMG